MMIRNLSGISVLLLCLSWRSLSTKVDQTPSTILGFAHDLKTISCSHSISSYNTILWYQQPPGDSALSLIGYVYYTQTSLEEPFKLHFNVTGDGEKKSQLHVLKLRQPEDSGVYYCAARDRDSPTSTYPAYFGQGTKVTVLEYDVKEPTVEVFRPSSKQCLNLKSEEKEKTLLCVAKDFYPDHISVSWESGGVAVTTGVATDSFAARDGEFYKISSRLRVNAEDWYEKEYECIVTFFNGTNYNIHTAYIYGEEAPKDFHIREKYLRATQTAKLSYTVFIIKSSIYGAFVAFLVWKLKGSSGKQNG